MCVGPNSIWGRTGHEGVIRVSCVLGIEYLQCDSTSRVLSFGFPTSDLLMGQTLLH